MSLESGHADLTGMTGADTDQNNPPYSFLSATSSIRWSAPLRRTRSERGRLGNMFSRRFFRLMLPHRPSAMARAASSESCGNRSKCSLHNGRGPSAISRRPRRSRGCRHRGHARNASLPGWDVSRLARPVLPLPKRNRLRPDRRPRLTPGRFPQVPAILEIIPVYLVGQEMPVGLARPQWRVVISGNENIDRRRRGIRSDLRHFVEDLGPYFSELARNERRYRGR